MLYHIYIVLCCTSKVASDFSCLGVSMWTMFKLMTLDGWAIASAGQNLIRRIPKGTLNISSDRIWNRSIWSRAKYHENGWHRHVTRSESVVDILGRIPSQGSSVRLETIQRRLVWPQRKDDTHKSLLTSWETIVVLYSWPKGRVNTCKRVRQ